MSFDTFESKILPARRKERVRHARNSGFKPLRDPIFLVRPGGISRWRHFRDFTPRDISNSNSKQSAIGDAARPRGDVYGDGRSTGGREGRRRGGSLARRVAAGARCFDIRVVGIVVSWSFSVFPRKNRAHSAGRKNWGAERMATSKALV